MIRLERTSDYKKVLSLEEEVLGPGRFARPSFRLRENNEYNKKYSKVYCRGIKLLGSIRYSNCTINEKVGLMLGPLIVDQKFKGQGIGRELVNKSLKDIKDKDIVFVVLIGEFEYYKQFGFEMDYNIYFSLNVRKEKVLFRTLSKTEKDLSGKIELF